MVSSTERAIDLAKYDACIGELSDWSKADALGGGIDLGSRDDLAAFALCARFVVGYTDGGSPVYRYEFRSKAFIAADTARQLDVMPFSQFLFDGDLQRVQYPLEDLTSSLIEDCGLFGVQTVAYDQYNALQLSEMLGKEGIIAAKMPQNQSNFNEPIREFLKLMNEVRLCFPPSRLMRWAANNAKVSRDRQDRWMFDKAKSDDKIDPLVAMVMAFRICSLQPERSTGSMYLT
jgi:phage terminase large subunit-like protein